MNFAPMVDAKYQNDEFLVAKSVDHPPVPDAKTIMAVRHGFDTRTVAWRRGQPEKGRLNSAAYRCLKRLNLPLRAWTEREPPGHAA